MVPDHRPLFLLSSRGVSGYDFGYKNRVNICSLVSDPKRSPRESNSREGFGMATCSMHLGIRRNHLRSRASVATVHGRDSPPCGRIGSRRESQPKVASQA